MNKLDIMKHFLWQDHPVSSLEKSLFKKSRQLVLLSFLQLLQKFGTRRNGAAEKKIFLELFLVFRVERKCCEKEKEREREREARQ